MTLGEQSDAALARCEVPEALRVAGNHRFEEVGGELYPIPTSIAIGDEEYTLAENGAAFAHKAVGTAEVTANRRTIVGPNAHFSRAVIIGRACLVDGTLGANVQLSNEVTVGTGTGVGADTSIGERTTVGMGAFVGEQSQIGPGVSIGDKADIRPQVRIEGAARVGDNTRVGSNAAIGHSAVVGDHVRVGEYATIGASARIGDSSHLESGVAIGESAQLEHGTMVTEGLSVGTEARVLNDTIVSGNVPDRALAFPSGRFSKIAKQRHN